MAVAALHVSRFLTVLDDHRDATDRFAALATLCGWKIPNADALEVTMDETLDAEDYAAARRLGATIKCVLWAMCDDHRLEAFAGPALIPLRSALASNDDELSGFQLAGCYGSSSLTGRSNAHLLPCTIASPSSEWLVRMRFPGVTPSIDAAPALLARAGLTAISAIADARTHWVPVARVKRVCTEKAIGRLRHLHRVDVNAIRAL